MMGRERESRLARLLEAGSRYPELDWAVKDWPRVMNMDAAAILEEIQSGREGKVTDAEALFIMVNDIIGNKIPRQN